MIKYRGFPSRMPGSNYQFTIRRANPKGATKLIERVRYRDRKLSDRQADKAFLIELLRYFGEEPFQRGCLDAGRLSWLFGREVVIALEPFDPCCYHALLRLNLKQIRRSFPEIVL